MVQIVVVLAGPGAISSAGSGTGGGVLVLVQ